MKTRDYTRRLNATVRKHKRVHERRRALKPAKTRPDIAAQVGSAQVGTEAT